MKKSGALAIFSINATRDTFERRNQPFGAKGQFRHYLSTPVGRRVVSDLFLPELAAFLAGKLPERPTRLRGDVGALFAELCRSCPDGLALAVLAPLLDCIKRGWDGHDTASWKMHLCRKLGREMRDRLALNTLLISDVEANREAAKAIQKMMKKG
jgi:hypothetical protein